MGGANAFAAGSYAGPTTVAGQWDNLVSGAKNLVGAGTPQGAEAFPVAPPRTDFSVPDASSASGVDLGASQVSGGYQPAPFAPQQPSVAGLDRYAGVGGGSEIQYGGSAVDPSMAAPTAATAPAPTAAPSYTSPIDTGGALGADPTGGYGVATPGAPPPGGTEKGFFGNLFDKISPSTPSQEVLNQKGFEAVDKLLLQRPDATIGQQNLVFNNAVKAASPSILRQYGPLALGGLGVMSLAGGFKQPESEQPNITGGVTGQQLLEQDPAKYGLPFGGATTTYTTPPAYYNPRNYQSQAGDPYAIQPVRAFAEGGPSNVDGYPRKQGAINGPGTGTSDSIKALLSDGEFVFTAKAVRGAGQGSRRKGAKRMYQLMRSLEGKA